MSSITNLPQLLAIGGIGTMELIIIVVIGLLIFGRRLPEVGRNVGRSLVEFKKGVKGIEDDIDSGSKAQTSPKLTDQSVARHDDDVKKTSEAVQNKSGNAS